LNVASHDRLLPKKELQMNRVNTLLIAALAACCAGSVAAAGNITGIAASKSSLRLGLTLDASVSGAVQLDAFGKGCAARISLRYEDGTTHVVNAGFLVDTFPTSVASVKPTKVGKVLVTADGGYSSLQWPACGGIATTQITVFRLTLPQDGGPRVDIRR
jgi:hypothetical protein